MLLSRSRIARGRVGAALCLTAAMPFAFHVRESLVSDIEGDSSEPPIAANERAAKTWDVSGGSSINRVELRVPGLVYVTAEEAEGKMASVRVSGDSKELVECVEVVPLPPNGVQLRFKSKECASLRGHLLTSLILAREGHVNELKAAGGGTVVVEDGVLVTDCEHASVHVASEGSGDVYVTNKQHAINLKELRLSVLGSGRFQFVGPETMKLRDQFVMDIAGSGKMTAFVGNITTGVLKASIAGSGDAAVVARGGYVLDKLKTSIAGSGKATYAGDGQCRVQRFSVTGSGTVLAHDIRCEDASISAIGESDVTWQVANKLTSSGWSSTTIRYVNELPKVIEGKSVTIRPATPLPSGASVQEPAQAPSRENAFSEIEAVYESKTDAFENVTSLGKVRRFLMNAFVVDDKKITVDVKTESTKTTK